MVGLISYTPSPPAGGDHGVWCYWGAFILSPYAVIDVKLTFDICAVFGFTRLAHVELSDIQWFVVWSHNQLSGLLLAT